MNLEFFHNIREQVRLSDVIKRKVTLTRKYREYIGLCPFHVEKTPSFHVNDVKKMYYCFGCHASGDVIKFIAKINDMSYRNAALMLAKEYNIAVPSFVTKNDEGGRYAKILQILAEIADFFLLCMLQEYNKFSTTQIYLTSRNIDIAIIKEFKIGFLSDSSVLYDFCRSANISKQDLEDAGVVVNGRVLFCERIIFPISNAYGKIIAFGARTITGAVPKYINSHETICFKKKQILYGENKAINKIYKLNYCIVVEGYFDVIMLHKVGFTEAVAVLGTNITVMHISRLWNICNEIIICFDADDAGYMSINKLIELALPMITSNNTISFIQLPNKLDPDLVVLTYGQEYFKSLIDKRYSFSMMIWEIECRNYVLYTAESRAYLANKLDNICNKINDTILKSHFKFFFKQQIYTKVSKKNDYAKQLKNNPLFYMSTLDIIEYTFCAILIYFPYTIDNEDNFIPALEFKNTRLNHFKNLVCDLLTDNSSIALHDFEKIIIDSGFHDIFLLLSSSIFVENTFITKVTIEKNINNVIFWNLLQNKYNLILLKSEYDDMKMYDNSTTDRARLYSKEFIKITDTINKLTELLM